MRSAALGSGVSRVLLLPQMSLSVPVLLWVGVACFVIILFAVFLVFKSVQLLGQMREK